MSFEAYNARIRVGPSGTGHIIPITDMKIVAEPFTGENGTTLELFDGRRIQKVPVYRYRVELNWGNLGKSSPDLLTIVNYLFTEDGANLFPVYDESTGAFDESKVIENVIPQVTDETFYAQFNLRARSKGASLTLVSKDADDAAPKSWIMS